MGKDKRDLLDTRIRKHRVETMEIAACDLVRRLGMEGDIMKIEQCNVYVNGNAILGWRISTSKEIE